MAIICVRHTRPQVAEGTCYGRTDLDVAETFDREAEDVIQNLARPDVIISSPLLRCQKLARRISVAFDRPVKTDARLSEMNFGTWEGLAWDDIPRAELDDWAADFLHAKPHGGESVASLRARVVEAYRSYKAASSTAHLWVCHAGVIKAVMSRGDTADDFKTSVDFGGIITLPDYAFPLLNGQ